MNEGIDESFMNVYQTMFGENDKFDFKASKFYIMIYFGITIGMNVMILNLLVCIISNTFERI